MSDQGPERVTRAGDEPLVRPLPDGGLAESMPDWLRRPPAWRDTTAGRSYLPPPDTSPIDPGTLIDVEDLSPWLQRIARRSEQRPAATPVEQHRAASRSRTIPVIDPHRLPRGSADLNDEARSSLRPNHQLHAGAGGKTQQRTWLRIALLLLLLVLVIVVGVVVFAWTS